MIKDPSFSVTQIAFELGYSLLICSEIYTKNGHLMHRKLTRLLLARSLKRLLFALLDTAHFQAAKVGSIQHANQHQLLQIQIVDERIHHPNRIVFCNVTVKALREQRALRSVLTFNETLHPSGLGTETFAV
jgi:hypothetical protein